MHGAIPDVPDVEELVELEPVVVEALEPVEDPQATRPSARSTAKSPS